MTYGTTTRRTITERADREVPAARLSKVSATGHVEELSKIADLKRNGDITAAEHERATERVLAD
ncbi:hypothetical protein R6L23_00710 [Streptomyces sp. SR27]|uniref:hypothetical protein n=1 Tax=Streptomyces sp. SR27 TaxID=3076630 RepID=UPI00295B576A|nr:hypothetical protein [Streptomyces sp. SR27]MDV9186775.1 hypothetical protein [Streptomyces sp. SR27]